MTLLITETQLRALLDATRNRPDSGEHTYELTVDRLLVLIDSAAAGDSIDDIMLTVHDEQVTP